MDQAEENKFLCHVIKELLNLCERSQTKSNKAFIATDIMYVVGQFPVFLRTHWAFLKTVMNKLHEFMHEPHPGVQDMASETYLKISKLTKEEFVKRNDKELEPYVNVIIRDLPRNCEHLEDNQKYMVFESIAWMISSEIDLSKQDILINNLLSVPNQEFLTLLNHANNDMNQLFETQNVKKLD